MLRYRQHGQTNSRYVNKKGAERKLRAFFIAACNCKPSKAGENADGTKLTRSTFLGRSLFIYPPNFYIMETNKTNSLEIYEQINEVAKNVFEKVCSFNLENEEKVYFDAKGTEMVLPTNEPEQANEAANLPAISESNQVGKLCELLCFVCELVHTCEVLQFMNDYFDLLERAKHLGIQLPHYEIRRAEKKEKRPIIKDEAADLQEVKRWLSNSEKLGAFSRDKASFVFVVEQF